MRHTLFTRALWLIVILMLLPIWTVTGQADDFDRTQTLNITLPDMGTVTLYIPETWVSQVHTDGVLYIADSAATLEKGLTAEADEFGPGDQSFIFSGLPHSQYSFYDLPPDAPVEETLAAFAATLVVPDGPFSETQFSGIKSFYTHDRPAALITGFAQGGDYDYGTVVGMVEVDGGVVLLFSVCYSPDAPGHTALMHAIMRQMEFAPAVSVDVYLPERISADVPMVGTYAVNYPEDWYAEPLGGGMLLITSSEALMDRAMDSGLPDIDAGDAGILAVAIPEMLYPHMDSLVITEDSLPEEVLGAYVIMLNGDSADTEFSVDAPRPLTLGDTPAATATGSIIGPDTTNALTIIALSFEDGGGYVFLLLQTALDEGGDFDAILTGIAETYTFTPEEE
jgi:hypothetical protein